jgi:hypothetical protein
VVKTAAENHWDCEMRGGGLIFMAVLLAGRLIAAAEAPVPENVPPPEFSVELAQGGVFIHVLKDGQKTARTITLAAADLADPESLKRSASSARISYADLNSHTRLAKVEIDIELKHQRRSILALLVKQPRDKDAEWALRGEFVANSTANGAMASVKTTQTLSGLPGEKLDYTLHSKSVFDTSLLSACPCCLPMVQSPNSGALGLKHTVETMEEEKWQWLDAQKKFEKRESRKWYVLQPGDTFKIIADKLADNGTLLGRLYALNPGMEEKGLPPAGGRVLVERDTPPQK